MNYRMMKKGLNLRKIPRTAEGRKKFAAWPHRQNLSTVIDTKYSKYLVIVYPRA